MLRLRCVTCQNVKPEAEFYERAGSALGRKRECIPCYKLREQNNRFLKLYGLTTKQYFQKLEDQGSICANEECKLPLTGGNGTHLDHDHETGVNREFLCRSCNVAEGHLNSSPEIAMGLIDYMRKHNGKKQEG
jgi:hypothetical protein